jgi:hypothetical protein
MPISDFLLAAVALRLAVIVLAGLMIYALPNRAHSDMPCSSAARVAAEPDFHRVGDADATLRDMLLHD